MTLRIVVVLALAAAIAFSPTAMTAREGHDHGKKAKKVKKSKTKQVALEGGWRARPRDMTAPGLRGRPRSRRRTQL